MIKKRGIIIITIITNVIVNINHLFFSNHHLKTPPHTNRKLGASEGTINQEIQRYQQLESVAVNDIRRDVRKKLRRSSMRVRRKEHSTG